MHDKIIQISTEKAIPENAYISAEFLPEWFVGSVADYVDDDLDMTEDDIIEMFDNLFYKSSDGSVRLNIMRISEAYTLRYERLRAIAQEVLNSTEEDIIAGKLGSILREMEDCHENRFGTYVYDEDEGALYTLDRWLDYHYRHEPEKLEIHLGAILDYHW